MIFGAGNFTSVCELSFPNFWLGPVGGPPQLAKLSTKEDLRTTGKILQDFIIKTTQSNPHIQYLLIIEGQASKDGYAYNYELSYQRALSLKKFWEDNGLNFNDKNCEVLICGSGDGRLSGTGLMRESKEVLNQRFLIHILPKPGKIGD